MEAGLYAQTRSVHDVRTLDPRSEALALNTFVAPLPYVGTTLEPLTELPQARDHVACMDTSFPRRYTSWNFQTHTTITSFAAWEAEANLEEAQTIRQPAVTILIDGALEQVLRLPVTMTARTRSRLLARTYHLASTGQVFTKLPTRYTYRSTVYSISDATKIAESIGAPAQTQGATPVTPTPSTSQCFDYEVVTPEEPAMRSKVDVIPTRVVKTQYTGFQANTPTAPPKSAKCVQLEAYATNADKSATQPLLTTARSPIARDLPSLQMLLAYMNASNASYIDSAPIVRGLCYSAARHDAMYTMDRTTNHFLRREDLSTEQTSARYIHDWPADVRIQTTIICVSLPAYTSHLKSSDVHLSQTWPLNTMDKAWVAVPITSDMITENWLKEYVLCFLDSRVWAGRMCRRVNTRHCGEGAAIHPTSFTLIPECHNVHIPGPQGVMLVMLDENVTATNSRMPIIFEDGLAVYPGSQYVRNFVNINAYQRDCTELMHNLLHDYNLSAERMCHALEWMESNLCVDMAFQLAFSIASDLSSVMPESPYLDVEDVGRRRYGNALSGAWTIGQHNYSADSPRHTTSDINAGPLANRVETYTRNVHGYNFASVTPMQQYRASWVKVTNEAVIDGDRVVGYKSHWTQPLPDECLPQYTVHASHSVYRILSALGLIEKNDYRFCIATTGGLQAMLALQGSALTLSLTVYMSRNDISRRMWSGLMEEAGSVARASTRNKLNYVSAGHLIPTNAEELFRRNHRAGRTISDDIHAYYDVVVSEASWAVSVCVPFYAVVQL